jgi:hypothetical protein
MKASIDLEANKAGSNKDSYCKHCKRKGHVKSNCYKKYPELKPKNKANKPSSKKSKKSDKKDSKDSSNKDNNNKAESSKVIINVLSNNQTIKDNISSINYFSKSNNFKNKLVLDSGATKHYPFSCHQELIFGAEKLVVPEKIKYLNINTKYKQLS